MAGRVVTGTVLHVQQPDPSTARPVCRPGVVLDTAGDAIGYPSVRVRVFGITNAVGVPVGFHDVEGWYRMVAPAPDVAWRAGTLYGAHRIEDCGGVRG